MSDLLNLRPLHSNLHLRLLKEAEQTAGGIYLPDTLRDNWTSGEVIARGPGYPVPDSAARSVVWSAPGSVVMFPQSQLRLIDLTQAVVADEDVIAVQPETGEPLCPMNDWVEIELIDRDESTIGGIIIPEDQRQRANFGVVLDWGPGKLRLWGPYYGSRKSVPGIIGVTSKQLLGAIVYWPDSGEAVEAGRQVTETLFVRAGDLMLWKAGDTDG